MRQQIKDVLARIAVLEREVTQLNSRLAKLEKNEERETHPKPLPLWRGFADIAEPDSPLREGLGEALSKLLHHRTPDGRYLVTRKVPVVGGISCIGAAVRLP